ncbi:hypothetical protein QPL79_00675 [Ignisphaera sp. 4213-co]|uniref:FtsX-like permease family protein n=1 Tax=Ignisphaera cupida TaxID=3050454 RepID=A0ABD4Z6C0_9CREN|nr:hypothetical protein [Ignisphaera sp. 4213-co]MDK6027880.1 hypothetical protein [Ignisphaera sp. 4213-co]
MRIGIAAKLILVGIAFSMPIACAVAIVLGVINALYTFYGYVVYRNENEIVVSNMALAPFTALMDFESLMHRLKNVSGLSIDSEVMVLALVNEKTVLIRGIEANSSRYISDFSNLSNCLYCCVVGSDLAKALGIELDSFVIVSSMFQPISIPLKVVGYTNEKPYSYEVVVPIAVARILRRATSNQVSVAYIHAWNRESIELLYKSLDINIPRPLLEKIFIAIEYMGQEKKTKFYSSVSEAYFSRLGINQTTIIAASIALSAIVALGLYLIGQSILHLIKNEIVVLRVIGVPKILIAIILCIAILVSMVLSWLLTYIAIDLIKPGIVIINHSIQLVVDPHVYASTFVIAYAITVVGIVRSGELNE